MKEFAQITESIFRHSERRVDVDKWYTRLVRAMFDVVPRLADENSKTPPDVIKMGPSTTSSSSHYSALVQDLQFQLTSLI